MNKTTETNARPVDVLAVMDRFANTVLPVKLWDGRNPYCGSPGREGSDYQNDLVALIEARAAVAELVASIGPVLDWVEDIEDEDSRVPRPYLTNLRAALAKFGGQS